MNGYKTRFLIGCPVSRHRQRLLGIGVYLPPTGSEKKTCCRCKKHLFISREQRELYAENIESGNMAFKCFLCARKDGTLVRAGNRVRKNNLTNKERDRKSKRKVVHLREFSGARIEIISAGGLYSVEITTPTRRDVYEDYRTFAKARQVARECTLRECEAVIARWLPMRGEREAA